MTNQEKQLHLLGQIRTAYTKANPLLKMQVGEFMNPMLELMTAIIVDQYAAEIQTIEMDESMFNIIERLSKNMASINYILGVEPI